MADRNLHFVRLFLLADPLKTKSVSKPNYISHYQIILQDAAQEKQKENPCFHPTKLEASPARLLFHKFETGTGTEEVLL